MKLLKTVLAGVVALSFVSAAHAAVTTIRICGSSAFRAATHAAIGHLLAANGSYSVAQLTGALGSSNAANFYGNWPDASHQVLIQTGWTGSVGGIQTVGQAISPSNGGGKVFIDASITTTGTYTATTTYTPDICLSDVTQGSTPYNPSAAAPLYTQALTSATCGAVGVCPFRWLANVSAKGVISNMNPNLAQQLYAAGQLPAGLFAGGANASNLADATAGGTCGTVNSLGDHVSQVYAVGRDADSGTRLTAVIESGIGLGSILVQYYPINAAGGIIGLGGTTGAIADVIPTPGATINTIYYGDGDIGYSSGGNLATAFSQTSSGLYIVGYISRGDSKTPIANGAAELTWNGVMDSDKNITEGAYTFWSYEHLYYRNASASAFANALANKIHDADAVSSGILMTAMKAARGGGAPVYGDGGYVANTY